MSSIVPILAALSALAAAAARLPRWKSRESRPFTIGMVLLAVYALIRTPAINGSANEMSLPNGHFEGFPGLIANMALAGAGALIGVTVADAWGRALLRRAFYLGLIAVEAAMLLTYSPLERSYLTIQTHNWILAVSGIAVNAAVIAASALSYRTVAQRFRLPLSLFMFGVLTGMTLAVIRVVTLLHPAGPQVNAWSPIVSIPIFGFALGSLVASLRMRKQEVEDIDA
ncbi:hypothetical protein [Nocardia seriolae]|uniref:DUF2306 domain-containing protein n=1 Tax=Nocardia seriolae TaxID=37332 RepID=A0ABC9Z441_9NOCA|nr:hypothetical protein [Nocardia seriolae]BEK97631.1 hypothetical protein NSER024013_55370 [Nocardia seriolae]GAM50352.1 hypothetical protein NS07_v2contig00148-0019 [Nocardia seriolae]GAP32286.1 hypothetical protein NSK11_contig00150-0004 [Nocardia seriolae]